jgi:hypothetical protein
MSKLDLYHDEKRYNAWKIQASNPDYREGELTKKTSDRCSKTKRKRAQITDLLS